MAERETPSTPTLPSAEHSISDLRLLHESPSMSSAVESNNSPAEVPSTKPKQMSPRRPMSCEPIYHGSQAMEPLPSGLRTTKPTTSTQIMSRKAKILARDYEKQKREAQKLTAEEKRLLMEELRPKGWQRPESITKPLTPLWALRSPSTPSYMKLKTEEAEPGGDEENEQNNMKTLHGREVAGGKSSSFDDINLADPEPAPQNLDLRRVEEEESAAILATTNITRAPQRETEASQSAQGTRTTSARTSSERRATEEDDSVFTAVMRYNLLEKKSMKIKYVFFK